MKQELLNNQKNEIILYQPDNTLQLEVMVKDDTVWLTQAQMVVLFGRDQSVISRHINNIFREGELNRSLVYANFAYTATDGKIYDVEHYNLDVIISVGYRVKSKRGTQFRIWATNALKDYILRGYAINQRFERIESFAIETEKRVSETEKKIDFFVKTALPPIEGIFYDGQIFEAYTFVSNLVKSARQHIVLIDNYIDETVLALLSKRCLDVTALIYTKNTSSQLSLDIQKHNSQYPTIEVEIFNKSHDRFLIIDDTVYHIGASLKDLGRKWFAFSKMTMSADDILQRL
jgi:hypothetical protein